MCRAFRNIGRGDRYIAFSPRAREEIEAVPPGLAAEFEKAGFTFDAAAR